MIKTEKVTIRRLSDANRDRFTPGRVYVGERREGGDFVHFTNDRGRMDCAYLPPGKTESLYWRVIGESSKPKQSPYTHVVRVGVSSRWFTKGKKYKVIRDNYGKERKPYMGTIRGNKNANSEGRYWIPVQEVTGTTTIPLIPPKVDVLTIEKQRAIGLPNPMLMMPGLGKSTFIERMARVRDHTSGAMHYSWPHNPVNFNPIGCEIGRWDGFIYIENKEDEAMEIENVVLINGDRADRMDDSTLIHHIKNEKDAIRKLNDTGVTSKRIAAKIKQHEENIDRLVKLLDERED